MGNLNESQDSSELVPVAKRVPAGTGELKHYSPALLDVLKNLYYRQSMIKDYMDCPAMMLFRWILKHEEEDNWMAAFLGTAGHKVIENMHIARKFDWSYVELTQQFLDAVADAISDSRTPPRIGAQFKTIKAQCESCAPEYVEMLTNYQKDETNQKFHATMLEQMFVLPLVDEFGRAFLFTGTIDQAGVYWDGRFALRDIKFRQNAFKPKFMELKLDIQLSLYSYALRHGYPSCSACAPQYTIEGELIYAGPCSNCEARIGTGSWPKLMAESCEIIWMRDYNTRKKDEFAKYKTSETEKEINPATGRLRKKQEINPQWITGYKIGDQIGTGHLKTSRTSEFLSVHISDILRLAGMIRDGRFYRKPSDKCNFWCKYTQPCQDGLEMEVEELDMYEINAHMTTLDPFSDG
jgi:hypothetical protein